MTQHLRRDPPGEILVVTGTGTDVGKTVITAALAAVAQDQGRRVAIVKPAQTGLAPGEQGDARTAARLSKVADTLELVRYPDPLAPGAAARVRDLPDLPVPAMAGPILALAADHDLVVVEGAGGLLVELDRAGATIADLAVLLGAPLVVVADPRLGTLNHTALTLAALRSRGLECAGIVLGRWLPSPDLASCSNLTDLAAIAGEPVAGAIPAGATEMSHPQFVAASRAGLAPRFGGTFDGAEFTRRFRPAPLASLRAGR